MKLFTVIALFFISTFTAFACNLQPKFAYRTKGLTVTFNNKTAGEYINVLWNFGNGATSTANSPQHTYSEAGIHIFSLTVSDKDNCSTTFEGKVYVFDTHKTTTTALPTPKITTENSNTALTITPTTKKGTVIDNISSAKATTADTQPIISRLNNYPNPFVSSTTLSFEVSEQTAIQVTVYDIWGRIVKVLANGVVESGHQEIVFERENLATGIYLVTISTRKNSATRLIAVQ